MESQYLRLKETARRWMQSQRGATDGWGNVEHMPDETMMTILTIAQIDDPSKAKQQLPLAEEQVRSRTAARDEAERKHQERLEVKEQDRLAADYLRKQMTDLATRLRQKRAEVQNEIRTMRESCDAAAVAQDLSRANPP